MRLLVAGLAAINSTILFGCCLWQARSQGPLAKKTRAQVRTLCHRWVTLLRHLGLDQYWEEMVDYILSGDHPLVQVGRHPTPQYTPAAHYSSSIFS